MRTPNLKDPSSYDWMKPEGWRNEMIEQMNLAGSFTSLARR
jgi:hypothetical protein